MAKTRRVALYLKLAQVHHQGIANGVMRYARERGNWQLFGAYWPLSSIKDFRKWDGDGIIAAIESMDEAGNLFKPGIPVVDISGAVDHPRLTRVSNDNVAIGLMGGEHLLRNGFERFAFAAADGSLWSEERLEGFAAAVRRAGLEAPAVFRKKVEWWHSPEFSRELANFLARQERPFGLMSANDIVGMNVVGSCRLAGLSIPDDMAIVSVDNEDFLCELSTPTLSSIPFDRHEIGFRAAERLDALMRKLIPHMPPLRIPPLPLVERASSAHIAVADPLVAEALAYIRKNAATGIGAVDVVRHAHASRRSLEDRFRLRMGHSILTEIHHARVACAKHLLRETDLAISKVALRSGFKSLNRFAAVFVKHAGATPRAYRRGGDG